MKMLQENVVRELEKAYSGVIQGMRICLRGAGCDQRGDGKRVCDYF